ncbi:MAG: response regulator [Vicinamibacterales bacterium]
MTPQQLQRAAGVDFSILLVEDNPADARLVREYLREEHDDEIAVTHATKLREALTFLETQNFNAILLDLSLPDSQGLETFVRARAGASRVPIVVLTGLADEQVAASAVREGAQDYLVKGQVDGRALYQSLRYAVERYAVTAQLGLSERRYRSLVEGSIQGILIHAGGTIRFANPAFARMLGAPGADALEGTSIWTFIDPDDRARLEQFVEARSRGTPDAVRFEVRCIRHDGTRIWLDCITSPVVWDDEPAVLETVVDITARKQMEADLRVSEERFRLLADHINEAFIITELPSFRPIYLSGAWEQIWGRPTQEAFDDQTLWFHTIHPDDRQGVLDNQIRIAAGEPTVDVFRIERPDRSWCWIRTRAFPVRSQNGQVQRMVALAEDITETRRSDEELQQSQKMEAIGRLAGGIAHDFNNLLSAILGFSDLLLEDLGADHPSHPDVDQIRQAARTAETLTRQLLAFSRRQILQPQDVDLNDAVRSVQNLLRRALGKSIALDVRLADSLGRIRADAGQMEQVVMNLILNARDAMPGGGRLTIETLNVAPEGADTPQAETPHVMLVVSDTGTGMDEETMKRVFEPFFTTKGTGKGTGLGLATVYGIVKQNQGAIQVESTVGVGSTFRVSFPVTNLPELRRPNLVPTTEAGGGTETILVVDDQQDVRAVVGEILRRHGYTVLEAGSGPQAIGLAASYRERIHLVLTDMQMPDMGGHELADRLVASLPGLRVVYMSSFTNDQRLAEGVRDATLAFVQKPFTPAVLLGTIREALGTPKD